MFPAIAVAALLLILAALAYVGWFAHQATGAFPYRRVEPTDAPDSETSTADVTLVGTTRRYRLVRVTNERAPDHAPLPLPAGLDVETDHERRHAGDGPDRGLDRRGRERGVLSRSRRTHLGAGAGAPQP